MELDNITIRDGVPIEQGFPPAVARALLDGVRRAQPPYEVKGGRITVTASGWALDVTKSRGGPPTTPPQPFELVKFTPEGPSPDPAVKVIYSTLLGQAPTVPEPEEDNSYVFTPSTDTKIYAKVVIDDTTGEISSRELVEESEPPTDTDTDYYEEIGAVMFDDDDNMTVSNARYGPVGGEVCRDWFAASAPFYSVSFQ